MLHRLWQSGLLSCLLLCSLQPGFSQDAAVRSHDPRIKVELFAEHPQIVTPTGLDIDHHGRVWAIESNTHFPPDGYQGHKTDRLLVMRDQNGDGRADEVHTFADGLTHAMSVAVRPLWYTPPAADGKSVQPLTVYVATRREILALYDDNGDLKADRRERLVHLETEGNYPHNGLAGFAFDAVGWMFFGFGENLGADYKVIGADGKTLTGGGEGGRVFRTRLDGTQLSRWATGFWNPHASCVDGLGNLFTVDNDPDSRPPCRLLHIIPDGDYGYRFRNGRKGLHPFTAWNGEIPGTLPMVAGTGEAPSGIIAYESDGLPPDFVGNLLVGSWGDHRIDRFVLQTKGSSFTSVGVPLITGSENFRPVGLSVAPDGSVYFTDWVLRDYKLHGKGRIWRISSVAPRAQPSVNLDEISKASEIQLYELLHSDVLPVRRSAAFHLGKTAPGRSLLVNQFADPSQPLRSRLEALWATVNLALAPNAPTDLLVSVRTLSAVLRTTFESSRASSFGGRGGEAGPLPRADGVQLASYWLRGTYPVQSILHDQVLTLAERSSSLTRRVTEAGSPIGLAMSIRVRNEQQTSPQLSTTSLSEGIQDPFQFSATVHKLSHVASVELFKQWWEALRPAKPDANAAEQAGNQPLNIDALREATPEQRAIMINQARGGRAFARADRERNDGTISLIRCAMVLAARQRFPKDQELLQTFLKDSDPLIRRVAIQWAAEEKYKELRPLVETNLNSSELTTDLFLATLAGLEMLDGVNPAEFDKTPASKYVLPLVQKDGPASVRALALRMVSPSDPALTPELFEKLLASPDEKLRLETIRTLQLSPLPQATSMLVAIAGDAAQSDIARAEAIAGLAVAARSDAADNSARKVLNKILLGDKRPLIVEALRSLRGVASQGSEALVVRRLEESVNAQTNPNNPPQDPNVVIPDRGGRIIRQKLTPSGEMREQIRRALMDPQEASPDAPGSSSTESVANLTSFLVGQRGAVPDGFVSGDPVTLPRGDAAAGRRVFFHANSAGCSKCHTVDGRGGKVGPDLTIVARTMDRAKLVRSILEPSSEIPPQFVRWNFELKSGQILDGLLTSEESEKLKITTADGKVHDLTLKDIESRTPQSLSLMPEKLAAQLTLQELVDLVAYLESLK